MDYVDYRNPGFTMLDEHEKILHQEKMKSKKKRVSFSIFTANTFEEIRDLRLEREKDFLSFVQKKTKLNESFGIPLDEKKSNCSSNIHNENKSNEIHDDKENELVSKNQEKFNKSGPVPNQIIKVENIFIENDSYRNYPGVGKTDQTNEDAFETKNDIIHDKNPELYFIHTLNTNSLDDHVLKENILFSNTYDYHSMNEENYKKPDFIISPMNELSPHELTNLSKINIVSNMENINIIEEEYIDVKYEEINSSNFKENDNTEALNLFFDTVEKIFFQNLDSNRVYFYFLFSNNFKKKIVYLEDVFLDDTAHLDSKINSFVLSRFFVQFRKRIETNINQKQNEIYNKNQSEKFMRYRNYKIKNEIFENLKFFCQKRANWLKQTKKDLMQTTIWRCFDSLKLYFNYRKIKTFLNYRKKTKIFQMIKANFKQSKEMIKRSKLLKYIFASKSFLMKARRSLLLKINKKYNRILSKEFKRNELLKRIFTILFSNLQKIKETKKLIKNHFSNKLKDSDYIHLKIYQNERTKLKLIQHDKNSSEKEKFDDEYICKRTIKNKINII